MPVVVRSPAARDDAVDIWLYIALHDIDAADRLAQRLDDRIESLADMPLTGQSRAGFGPDLRSVAVGKYLIFYRPISDGVEIVRVLHGSRDVARALRDD